MSEPVIRPLSDRDPTARAAVRREMGPRVRVVDVWGVALFAGAIGWSLLAGSRGGSGPLVALLVGSALVIVAARLLSRFGRPLVPTIVVIVAAGLAYDSRDSLLSSGPLSGPFGYANAKGAFFMLVAFAGLMIAVGSRHAVPRVGGIAAAVGAALVPFTCQVVASSVLLVVLALPMLLVAVAPRIARAAIGVCAGLFILALVVTGALGIRAPATEPSGVAGGLENALSSDRLVLWHEAEQLLVREPMFGVGPGRFRYESSFARANVSNLYFWAHNDFLQQGAELGVPGLVLSVALVIWAFAALWANPSTDVFVALAAAALAAAGIQACVDYVLHFPAVTLTAAALAGAGMAPVRPTFAVRFGGSRR